MDRSLDLIKSRVSLQYAPALRMLILLLTVLLEGCTSVEIAVPDPMIEAPDIPEKMEVGLALDPAPHYAYTGDASARPPSLSSPEVKSGAISSGRLGYALTERFEIGGRLLSNANSVLGGAALTGRLQLIGDKSSPFKAALYGGMFFGSTSAKGDQKGLFGPGGHNWKSEANATTLSAGLSVGYQASASILVFAAASYANQRIQGSIHHDASSDLTSPAADYALDTIDANTKAIALGLRFGEKALLQVDGRYLVHNWPGYALPTSGGGVTDETRVGMSLLFR